MNEFDTVFVVDDDAKADWCIDMINQAKDKIKQNEVTAKAILEHKTAEVKAWLAEQNAEAESTICRMQALLEPYISAALKDGKKKSVKLPAGSCGYRKQAPVFHFKGRAIDASVKQDAEFLQLAESVGEGFIKTERSVLWNELKKTLVTIDEGRVVTADGEIVDSLTAEIMPDQFYVKG